MKRLPATEAARAAELARRHATRSLESMQSYVRARTEAFYEWLASAEGVAAKHGPTIWICGDCHYGNLGPVAREDGEVTAEMRDLDQTVRGAPSHDLIRLSLSLVERARTGDLPGSASLALVERVAGGYVDALRGRAAGKPPRAIRHLLGRARRRTARDEMADLLGQDGPALVASNTLWPLLSAERRDIERLVEAPAVRALGIELAGARDGDEIEIADAAFWVKGCSSLGHWRAAVLVRAKGRKKRTGRSLALLDIKQAVAPRAPSASGMRMPDHHGARVVLGARALAPALGERMIPETVGGRQVVINELMPEDLKFELDFDREQGRDALRTGEFLGHVVGTAHARQLTPEQARRWAREIERARTRTVAAPAWLWRSVVELVGQHESAYLRECATDGAARGRRSATARSRPDTHLRGAGTHAK